MGLANGLFVFLGSTIFGLFTLPRLVYLLFGVAAGLLLGILETSLVTSKLADNTECFIWQVVPFGVALFGLPLLLVITVFGVSEYLPFGVYAFFPLLTTAAAISGWGFRKFEQENKVNAFMSYFGFAYWTQPALNHNELFCYFLKDVASKDPYHFWGQIGSSRGYIGYSNIFMGMLKEKTKIDSSTRKNLIAILKTMNKYRYIVLGCLAFLLVSVLVIVILTFGTVFGYINLNFNIVDFIGPASGVIFFSFVIGVFVLMQSFQRSISRLLANIDQTKLASCKK
jgi:hypothetical protein